MRRLVATFVVLFGWSTGTWVPPPSVHWVLPKNGLRLSQTPVPSEETVDVSGVLNQSLIVQGNETNLYVTLKNGLDVPLEELEIKLLSSPEIEINALTPLWPDSILPKSYVSRIYRVKINDKANEGEYILPAILTYSPGAREGRAVNLAELTVEPKTILPYPIPRELWVAVLTIMWTAFSGMLGFSWARLEDRRKRQALLQLKELESLQLLNKWLGIVRRDLNRDIYPGEIVHYWREFRYTHPLERHALKQLDPDLVNELEVFFNSLAEANAEELKTFIPRSIGFLEKIEKKLDTSKAVVL